MSLLFLCLPESLKSELRLKPVDPPPLPSPGLQPSCPVESMLFHPPPRITLKLKMPKSSSVGNGNPAFKSGNGPLCPDNSGNVADQPGEALGQGKPQLHGNGRREEHPNNGQLSSSSNSASALKSTGKPLALHAALHGHSSKSRRKLDQDRARVSKSNGLYEKIVSQKNKSSETPCDQYASKKVVSKSNFHKSAMEHFGRPFKDATISLVRTTEDLLASDKLSRDTSAKDRLWTKPVPEHKVKSSRSYQDSDGYCPDLELSDSEPEAKGPRGQQVERPHSDPPRKGISRGKQTLGSRHAMQR